MVRRGGRGCLGFLVVARRECRGGWMVVCIIFDDENGDEGLHLYPFLDVLLKG